MLPSVIGGSGGCLGFIQSLYLPVEPSVKAREAGARSLLFPCLS